MSSNKDNIIKLAFLNGEFYRALRFRGIDIVNMKGINDKVKAILEPKENDSKIALNTIMRLVKDITGKDFSLADILTVFMAKEISQIFYFKEEVEDSIVDFIAWRTIYERYVLRDD